MCFSPLCTQPPVGFYAVEARNLFWKKNKNETNSKQTNKQKTLLNSHTSGWYRGFVFFSNTSLPNRRIFDLPLNLKGRTCLNYNFSNQKKTFCRAIVLQQYYKVFRLNFRPYPVVITICIRVAIISVLMNIHGTHGCCLQFLPHITYLLDCAQIKRGNMALHIHWMYSLGATHWLCQTMWFLVIHTYAFTDWNLDFKEV